MPNQYTTGRAALLPCGTDAAYWRHKRFGTPACDPCLEAHRLYVSVKQKRQNAVRRAQALARKQAMEALTHRHVEEYRRLYLRAISENMETLDEK